MNERKKLLVRLADFPGTMFTEEYVKKMSDKDVEEMIEKISNLIAFGEK